MKWAHPLFNRRGQMFLMAGLITLLLLITIPLMVFLTNNATLHQTLQMKRSQALAIAESGISYASHQLNGSDPANPNAWTNALNGTFTGTDCAGPANVTVPGVGTFRLTCSASNTNSNLENYQVSVISTAYLPKGRDTSDLIPTRAMQAYLSRRTLGISLPNGTQASAALQLVRVPSASAGTPTQIGAGKLKVHWGPIACYQLYTLPVPTGDGPWVLPNPIDQDGGSEGYPRVFSNGGLRGTTPYPRLDTQETSAQSTDNTQWWAFASMQIPPQIDVASDASSYVAVAETQNTGTTQVGGGITATGSGCAAPVGNHYTGTAPCEVDLHGALTNLSASTVLVLDVPNVDVTSEFTGTLIVTGDMTVGVGGGLFGSAKTFNVPTAAYKEYMAPSAANPTYAWPCGIGAKPTAVGYQCTSTAAGASTVNFTGFLYVEGNLTVEDAWVVNGAIAVGDMSQTNPTGQLIIPALPLASSLTLFYDAGIGRSIKVLAKELQIDQIQEASPQ